MVRELQFEKEVAYFFHYDGNTYEEVIYVNGIDGVRYRSTDNLIEGRIVTPTTHKSTGGEYQELDAKLIATRMVDENDWSKRIQLLYLLPDTGEYVDLNCFIDKELERVNFYITDTTY